MLVVTHGGVIQVALHRVVGRPGRRHLPVSDPERVDLGDREAQRPRGHRRRQRHRASRAVASPRRRRRSCERTSTHRGIASSQSEASPSPLLQTWGWGEVQSRAGWTVERVRLGAGLRWRACSFARSVRCARRTFLAARCRRPPEAIDALVEWAREAKIAKLRRRARGVAGICARCLTAARIRRRRRRPNPSTRGSSSCSRPMRCWRPSSTGRRYNIRTGLKRGVVVEEGKDAAELARQSAAVERRESINLPDARVLRAAARAAAVVSHLRRAAIPKRARRWRRCWSRAMTVAPTPVRGPERRAPRADGQRPGLVGRPSAPPPRRAVATSTCGECRRRAPARTTPGTAWASSRPSSAARRSPTSEPGSSSCRRPAPRCSTSRRKRAPTHSGPETQHLLTILQIG